MKKLMIAAAIVCAAAMSQAATYNWTYTNMAGEEFCNLDGTKFTGTAYLFAGEDYEAYFNAWNANKDVDFTTVEGYAASATFANGPGGFLV